jgi:hypothetical protein
VLLNILVKRIRQFGGLRLVREYNRQGATLPMIKAIIRNPFRRQSYKNAYFIALNKVEPVLARKYGPMMPERKAYYTSQTLAHHRSGIIWFCWLQGLEDAPEIVKVCYASLKKHLGDREIKVIDGANWTKYVELPEHIIQRWGKKQIPPANFSDLLRLELLIRYGGTWIDATVLCTGKENTEVYLNADLFMFQYTRPGSDEWGGIGNWFITSCTNNEVLMVLRDMLYAYWKDYDCTLDYYIFHLFFSMLREVFPEEIAAMPYGYAARHIALAKHWGKKFDQVKWDRLVGKVSFHKLTYVIARRIQADPENYYHWILKNC